MNPDHASLSFSSLTGEASRAEDSERFSSLPNDFCGFSPISDASLSQPTRKQRIGEQIAIGGMYRTSRLKRELDRHQPVIRKGVKP